MPSPVTLYKGQLRVKICEKPKYWDDYATTSSATGEGSQSPQRHDGMAMPALGEGRGTLTHAVYFPTLQAPGSLFSILTIIFACIQLHQPKLVVTSWTIVFRDKLYLASPLKKKKISAYNLLFSHLPEFLVPHPCSFTSETPPNSTFLPVCVTPRTTNSIKSSKILNSFATLSF